VIGPGFETHNEFGRLYVGGIARTPSQQSKRSVGATHRPGNDDDAISRAREIAHTQSVEINEMQDDASLNDCEPCCQAQCNDDRARPYDGRLDLGNRRFGRAVRVGSLEAVGGGDRRGAAFAFALGWRPGREMVSEGVGDRGER
jgi:hypothetical protein